jgi:hypothetical protein
MSNVSILCRLSGVELNAANDRRLDIPMKKSAALVLPVFDSAPRIESVQGEIVVLGPGPVGFSMTPEAALLFAERLHEALAAAKP